MTPEERRSLQEKARRLKRRAALARRKRAESDRRIDRSIATLRELART